MSHPTCTAIVPFRSDASGLREANLATVLRWLDTMPVDVVVVQHGPRPAAPPKGAVRHLHVAADGPFSKAAACNAGFAVSCTPSIALVDADMLVDGRGFLGCVRRVLEDVDVIRPFGRLIDLDEEASALVRAGADPSQVPHDLSEPVRPGEVVPTCGGVVIMRAEAYERAGGMDETFEGWGGEDDALSTALLRTGSDCRVHTEGVGLHLWHPRDPQQRYRHRHYERNARRARWWSEATEAEVARAVATGRRRLRIDQEPAEE